MKDKLRYCEFRNKFFSANNLFAVCLNGLFRYKLIIRVFARCITRENPKCNQDQKKEQLEFPGIFKRYIILLNMSGKYGGDFPTLRQ